MSRKTNLLLKAISFASDKHRFQRRKDPDGTPYINHPVKVALTLSEQGDEDNMNLLLAAILHDTIEDTETTAEDIKSFGKTVLDIVLEVTDDKSLPKEERKRLQILNAPHKSIKAKKLKLADLICNITDIIHHSPHDWNNERKLDYFSWAEQVAAGLKGANTTLENHLAKLIAEGRETLK